MASVATLGELQLDLLREMINIGVGHASGALSQIVQQEILLSVPDIAVTTCEQLWRDDITRAPIVAIRQTLSGPLKAHSLLLFPETSSREVVRRMLGPEVPEETLLELQAEALSEIGNIVLNACIGVLANTLNITVTMGLPSYSLAPLQQHVMTVSEAMDEVALLFRISMALRESALSGQFVILLHPESLHALSHYLERKLPSTS
jgi:chemotaxis protein CheC